MKRLFKYSLLILLFASPLLSQSLHFGGQLSGWTIWNYSGEWQSLFGARYIPELSITLDLPRDMSLSLEGALNAWGTTATTKWKHFEWDGDIKPYRLWGRWTIPQFEVRLGLQKLSFGSATMLRPLMWFDRIDPRDPLQLTDGVYAVLFRYFFLNNANIWFWTLYGNDEPRGLDIVPSDGRRPEFGGRIQTPLLQGELALTLHHRHADLSQFTLGGFSLGEGSIGEIKVGLDGKWDWVVGFWFESMFSKLDEPVLTFTYQKALSFGMDYTFNLGNGLHIMGEHLVWSSSETMWEKGEAIGLTALSINYPIGFSDFLTGMVYYDWENQNLYRFLSWRHSSDLFTLHIIGFWNPDQLLFYQAFYDDNPFAGKGFQVMLVLNH